jgi:hypothetical protein
VYVDPGNPTPPVSLINIDILVNGVSQSIGSATKAEKNGIVSVSLVVDEQKLQDKIHAEGKVAVITVPVILESDEVIVSYNGTIVEYMVEMESTLLIETKQGTYTLPASLIDLEKIRNLIGGSADVGDLKLEIKLSAPTDQQLGLMEAASENGFLTLLGPAVNYTVSISHLGETYETKEFTSYVERSIALPDDRCVRGRGRKGPPCTYLHSEEKRQTLFHFLCLIELKNSLYNGCNFSYPH